MMGKTRKAQVLEAKGLPPKPEGPALTPEQIRQRQLGQLFATKGQLTRVIQKASERLTQVDAQIDQLDQGSAPG